MNADVFVHPQALNESEQVGGGTRIWAFAHVMKGAVVGERAALLNGTRTATLWARTQGRVAGVPYDALDPEALGSLAAAHRREE
jgi:CRP-like cAMP-binding protein